MREVRLSRTFAESLDELLAFGERRFGVAVALAKRRRVLETIEQLAHFPRSKAPDPVIGLIAYPVRGTPFVLLYEFDDREIRFHFVIHGRSDIAALDPSSAKW